MKKGLLLITLFIGVYQPIKAQNLKQANHLFENRAYLDAALLFEQEKNKTQEVLEKLGDCYYFNTQMESALKWYDLLIEEYSNTINPSYLFRYSQALKGIKKYKKSGKYLALYEKSKIIETETFKKEKLAQLLKEKPTVKYTVTKLLANTEESDFAGFIHGNKLIFSSTRTGGKLYEWNNKSYLDLYEADIDKYGELQNIKPFSEALNSKKHESNAVITKDGNTIYFTRNNLLKSFKNNKVNNLKIYKGRRVDNEWTNIKELPFNNSEYSVEHPVLNSDETQLYFSSDMPGTLGSFDLFVVAINDDGTYGEPKNLGSEINTEHREQFPVISNDTLYFSSDGHTGFGGLDIFKSIISNNGFSRPVNLNIPINSSLDDFGLIKSDDLGLGYFSSNREGGEGGDDIYKVKFKSKFINKLITQKGIVRDEKTLEPLPNTVLTLINEDDVIVEQITADENGAFQFEIEKGTSYIIKAQNKLYLPKNTSIKINNDNPSDLDILMQSYVVVEEKIIVKNNKTQIKHDPIYFDLNSSYIRKDAIPILNKIIEIIKKYPEINVECGSHTDSRASADYNNWLSQRRAKKTAEYLINNGISPDRITQNGFGETQLVNECSDGKACSETKHQLNRRTEFVLK